MWTQLASIVVRLLIRAPIPSSGSNRTRLPNSVSSLDVSWKFFADHVWTAIPTPGRMKIASPNFADRPTAA